VDHRDTAFRKFYGKYLTISSRVLWGGKTSQIGTRDQRTGESIKKGGLPKKSTQDFGVLRVLRAWKNGKKGKNSERGLDLTHGEHSFAKRKKERLSGGASEGLAVYVVAEADEVYPRRRRSAQQWRVYPWLEREGKSIFETGENSGKEGGGRFCAGA